MHQQDEFQQEIVNLKETLRQEKLKKADELLAHRLVYSGIIFVILFIALAVALDNANSVVQWLCLIPFFTIVLYVFGRIGIHFEKEKKRRIGNENHTTRRLSRRGECRRPYVQGHWPRHSALR
jgi:hypothetical protein